MASNVTAMAVGGEHRDTKKMKAVAVISQHISRVQRLMAEAPGRKVQIGQ